MTRLDAGYSYEVDAVDEDTWNQLLGHFTDANIYQSWSYGLVRGGGRDISHLVVKSCTRVVGIAQCRIETVPFLGAGIAYVMWGPLWALQHHRVDARTFRQIIRALHLEYVAKRGLLLRINPLLFEQDHSWAMAILREEGFSHSNNGKGSRTILMDLNLSMDQLYEQLQPHWKRELKAAQKLPLQIIEGVEDELFEQFIAIYKEMVSRKKFIEPNDIHEFRAIQRGLPAGQKMHIMLCRSSEGTCAGLVSSAIGSTAIYLFGATSRIGLKYRGSYLLQWKLIQRLKEKHVPQYDLNGINPEANPGTYKFKTDLAGEKGRDLRLVGRIESCENRISSFCVTIGERLNTLRQVMT
ncbi:MAG: peptidoglycan bridge formation glycyltransferase FemA/FemB family protein [Nitrospira sp.]|jgi:lipid II:glycine glycyltransferase (peptidoglycan interpeptide bridge formation enzyme)|nr:peptidoglycan bridge formation glycyltransferase FemA/FemB family protein [Nitrospira sp.]MBL8051910.1 peptidoglycan bridge formation glycyltransferase FemA/FemB family protein [Nitrospira sp.]